MTATTRSMASTLPCRAHAPGNASRPWGRVMRITMAQLDPAVGDVRGNWPDLIGVPGVVPRRIPSPGPPGLHRARGEGHWPSCGGLAGVPCRRRPPRRAAAERRPKRPGRQWAAEWASAASAPLGSPGEVLTAPAPHDRPEPQARGPHVLLPRSLTGPPQLTTESAPLAGYASGEIAGVRRLEPASGFSGGIQ